MKALSDPGRVTMLKLMQERPLCVCELTRCLGLAQPTVSRHLKLLEEAGLVVRRRDGQWVEYSLPAEPDAAAAELLAFVVERLEGDRRISRLRLGLRDVDRETACADQGHGRRTTDTRGVA